MMDVRQIAKAQFDQRKDNLSCVEVEQWQDPETGQAVKVYFRPLTFKDQQALLRYETSKTRMLACLLKIRARNEDGSLMFKDCTLLDIENEFDPEVVADIVSAMSTTEEDTESIKKN